MTTMLNRLILQLAIRAAFGTGQLVFAMAPASMPFAGLATQMHLVPPAITATVYAPVGTGWG